MEEKDRIENPTIIEIEDFIRLIFKNQRSVRGKTEGQLVNLKTVSYDCFHEDVDGVSICIGGPIEEKFRLEKLHFKWALPSHDYRIIDPELKAAFYKRYPAKEMSEQTLAEFAKMIYDLIKIRNKDKEKEITKNSEKITDTSDYKKEERNRYPGNRKQRKWRKSKKGK